MVFMGSVPVRDRLLCKQRWSIEGLTSPVSASKAARFSSFRGKPSMRKRSLPLAVIAASSNPFVTCPRAGPTTLSSCHTCEMRQHHVRLSDT